MSRSPHRWQPHEDALLGTLTDAALAARLDMGVGSVRERRSKLGIPPRGYVKSDGTSQRRPHQWTPEENALLGTLHDAEIARRIGMGRGSVSQRRRRAGIPAFASAGAPVKHWTPERESLLGTMSDGDVVKLLNVPGLNRYRASQRRRRLGIPAFKAPPGDPSLVPIDAAKIRARREALGLTRFALVGQNTTLAAQLGNLEGGHQKAVKPATLKKLYRLLKCKPADIQGAAPSIDGLALLVEKLKAR